MCNLTLAREEVVRGSEADECPVGAESATVQARQVTQQLPTFAKGGAPSAQPERLAPLIDQAARMGLGGSSTIW